MSSTPPEQRGLSSVLATRGRKVIAGLALAFLGGVGAAAFGLARNAGENATKKVFAGSSGGPLQVRVARPGTFISGHLWSPYYVIPKNRISGPDTISKAELASLRDKGWVDEAWAKEHGGISGSPEVVRLELRGTSDEPVTVTAIRAEVVSEKKPPLKGWYIAQPAGCGPETIRFAFIDLDAAPPTAEYFKDDSSPAARHLALSVTRTDAEQIEIWASTKKATVEWRAKIFYSGPKGAGSVTIDDEGRPFQVTTERSSDGYRGHPVGNQLITREHFWDKAGVTSC
jgi:hypothetical protein